MKPHAYVAVQKFYFLSINIKILTIIFLRYFIEDQKVHYYDTGIILSFTYTVKAAVFLVR